MAQRGFLSAELLDSKYKIERLLGEGGMGAVYRATHLGTKRAVAIKVIHPQFSSNDEFVERFRREAEAAGRLRHPNVVDVTDFGFAQTSSGQVAYLVMEYLDGCTLAEVLAEEERLPPDWVVEVLEQVCSAVDEAHRLGIIHRDLKPENIWLEPNRRGGYTIKVLDFGLAKLAVSSLAEAGDSQSPNPIAPSTRTESRQEKDAQAEVKAHPAATKTATLIQPPRTWDAATLIQKPGDARPVEPSSANMSEAAAIDSAADIRLRPKAVTGARRTIETAGMAALTRVGSIMGTPLYMSPEQCRGETSDARSDIYSLGVIAYRMLAGETPFTGNVDDLLKLHMTAEPQPIREKNSKVPRRMASIVMAALSKDAAARPESAAGFASALRAGVEGSGALLRRAVSLYSERFPIFLKLSLLAFLPLIAVIAFVNLPESVIAWEHVSPTVTYIIWPLLFIGMVVANLLAYSVVSAVTVPIVIQAMIAPLRPLRLRTAFAALKRRWLVFTATSVVILTMILVGTLFFVLPGAVAAVCYALYAPVVVMEGVGVRATLKRARRLMRRSWHTVLVITVLQFALPILVWVVSVDSSLTLKLADDWSPKEFSFNFSMSGRSSLYQLLSILVTPLTAIMTALLYLKTHQAGGESLRDAIEQFDALEIPRSKWQARMRSRLIASTSAEQSRGAEK